MYEILTMKEKIEENASVLKNPFKIYPLHSKLSTIKQKSIFKDDPVNRKIILATSIAETSITINDIEFVIDAGRMKMLQLDPNENCNVLKTTWVSLASATQRCGRAGRVKPGECYKLYTRVREEEFEKFPIPEVTTVSLDNTFLELKLLNKISIESFLGNLLTPPSDEQLERSYKFLKFLKAFDEHNNLTTLGYYLAHLPVDPKIGKLLIYGIVFSCVDPIFSIAACLSFKDAFKCYTDKKKKYKVSVAKAELAKGECSDHSSFFESLKPFKELQHSPKELKFFCWQNYLDGNILGLLFKLKHQFVKILTDLKLIAKLSFPSDIYLNENSRDLDVLESVLSLSFYPNLGLMGNLDLKSTNDRKSIITFEKKLTAKFHPCSVNATKKTMPTNYLCYFLKQRSEGGLFIHDSTLISINSFILAVSNHFLGEELKINKNLSYQCSNVHLIQKLHKVIEQLINFKVTDNNYTSWKKENYDISQVLIQYMQDEFVLIKNEKKEENSS